MIFNGKHVKALCQSLFFFSSAEVKTTKHLALATLSFCSGQYIDLDIFLMF